MEIEELKINDAEVPDTEEQPIGELTTEENESAEQREEHLLDEEAELAELREHFAETAKLTAISELKKAERYIELRSLGLSVEEAYLATGQRVQKGDNRSHLIGCVPRAVSTPKESMSHGELTRAREIFSDLSDREIHELYKKVTR